MGGARPRKACHPHHSGVVPYVILWSVSVKHNIICGSALAWSQRYSGTNYTKQRTTLQQQYASPQPFIIVIVLLLWMRVLRVWLSHPSHLLPLLSPEQGTTRRQARLRRHGRLRLRHCRRRCRSPSRLQKVILVCNINICIHDRFHDVFFICIHDTFHDLSKNIVKSVVNTYEKTSCKVS